MILPSYVEKAISILEESGFEAYVVGGCVRNFLLNQKICDYDLATSATPAQIKEVFCDYKTIDTGIMHGTVTLFIDSIPLEITTFRKEGAYSDHRRPDSVTFSESLKSDLMRRDFTVNALAYNPKTGIIDLFGGQSDLEKYLLACVGDGDKRFEEDALRILRAMRFMSQYSFVAEQNTHNAMLKNYPILCFVSKERIYEEFKKLLCGKNAKAVLKEYKKIVLFLLPSLGYDYVCTLNAVDSLPPDFTLRFCALFSSCEKNLAVEALNSLKADNKTINTVKLLLENLSKPAESKLEIKKLLSSLGKENLLSLFTLKEALFSFNRENALSLADKIIESGECFSLSNLAVNGEDLSALGFKGKEIGAALKLLLDAVIEERLPNDFNKLIKYLK